jgi:hypothetical protein
VNTIFERACYLNKQKKTLYVSFFITKANIEMGKNPAIFSLRKVVAKKP